MKRSLISFKKTQIKQIKQTLFFICCLAFCLSVCVPAAKACDYADETNPYEAFIEAKIIFRGHALKTGKETIDGKRYNFTLFEVLEPIKGTDGKIVRVYHKDDFKGYSKNTSGLVVSIERDDGLPLVDLCVLPFYDMAAPPGRSLYAVHKTILSRLGMILFVSAIFAGFMIYYFVKKYETA